MTERRYTRRYYSRSVTRLGMSASRSCRRDPREARDRARGHHAGATDLPLTAAGWRLFSPWSVKRRS